MAARRPRRSISDSGGIEVHHVPYGFARRAPAGLQGAGEKLKS
jgi:hypothetical protein